MFSFVPFCIPISNESSCCSISLSAFGGISVPVLAIQIGMQWEFICFSLRDARKKPFLFFQTHWATVSLGWLFTKTRAYKVYMRQPEGATSISVCYFFNSAIDFEAQLGF